MPQLLFKLYTTHTGRVYYRIQEVSITNNPIFQWTQQYPTYLIIHEGKVWYQGRILSDDLHLGSRIPYIGIQKEVDVPEEIRWARLLGPVKNKEGYWYLLESGVVYYLSEGAEINKDIPLLP
jgi:hypothetical protein